MTMAYPTGYHRQNPGVPLVTASAAASTALSSAASCWGSITRTSRVCTGPSVRRSLLSPPPSLRKKVTQFQTSDSFVGRLFSTTLFSTLTRYNVTFHKDGSMFELLAARDPEEQHNNAGITQGLQGITQGLQGNTDTNSNARSFLQASEEVSISTSRTTKHITIYG